MDSMEQIYIKYAKTVYDFLLTKSQNPDLAQEPTQETFYQAVKSISTFKGNSSVSTWLCGTAKNLLYEHLRKQKNHISFAEVDEISTISAEREIFCSWENINILKSLHNLEEPMREVMYLRLIGL